MIYITGDKHADFSLIFEFCKNYKTTKDDIMIILGDSGINYYNNQYDYILKDKLKSVPLTFFIIHGNHEERTENIKSYKTKVFHKGIVYYEEEYPNLLFAKDSTIYEFNKKQVLVLGGAYSIDKDYRLLMGYNWYPSEQMSDDDKKKALEIIKSKKIDIILSHTCPYKYLPREVFLSNVNPNLVDYSMEYFLDQVEESNNYALWYCGHFHTEKVIDKIIFMYNDIKEF